MQTKGLSQRRALAIAGMSASSLGYTPRPDRNGPLRQRIVALAQRHRRYGAGMIYLKPRQAGQRVNHKRVERLYGLEKLQIKRRRRKKIPVSERQPLIRPCSANDVWSMDFLFDRVAGGRTIKCLVIVDDATNECLAVAVTVSLGERSWCGQNPALVNDSMLAVGCDMNAVMPMPATNTAFAAGAQCVPLRTGRPSSDRRYANRSGRPEGRRRCHRRRLAGRRPS
jgi:hypothetical protein